MVMVKLVDIYIYAMCLSIYANASLGIFCILRDSLSIPGHKIFGDFCFFDICRGVAPGAVSYQNTV